MDLALLDYDLPPELIAQEPAEPRDAARLLVVDRASGAWEDRIFADLPALLRAGDCVVLNDSRVVPARLIGHLDPGGQAVELLMLGARDDGRWDALVRPGRRCRVGARVIAGAGEARLTVVGTGGGGRREGGGGSVERAEAARAPGAAAPAAVHRSPRRAEARGSRALPDGVRAARRVGGRADRRAPLHRLPHRAAGRGRRRPPLPDA